MIVWVCACGVDVDVDVLVRAHLRAYVCIFPPKKCNFLMSVYPGGPKLRPKKCVHPAYMWAHSALCQLPRMQVSSAITKRWTTPGRMIIAWPGIFQCQAPYFGGEQPHIVMHHVLCCRPLGSYFHRPPPLPAPQREGWALKGDYFVFERQTGADAPVIPFQDVIINNLAYTHEMERIV